MQMVLAVAAGGAIGAVARYWVVSAVGGAVGDAFPWGTLTVNVAGSAALGLLAGLMAFYWSPSPELRAFLVVGILGALTTFSAFSLDVVVLAERGQWVSAALYVVASAALSIGALFGALRAVRALAA